MTKNSWTMEQELLAVAVEVAYEAYRAQLLLGGVRRGRVPRSLRIPRPTSALAPRRAITSSPRARVATVDQIVAILDSSHKRIGS